MNQNPRYPVILRPLNDDDGGGWIAIVPDLPGCMSDGATGEDAFNAALRSLQAAYPARHSTRGGYLPARPPPAAVGATAGMRRDRCLTGSRIHSARDRVFPERRPAR